MKKTVICFLTTRWGPHLGGINVFNAEFCRSMAKSDNLEIICFVEEATSQDSEDARQSGLSLYSTNRRIDASEDSINSISFLVKNKIKKSISYWVGHDIWTGPAAVELSRSSRTSRSIVIHHMDFGAYAQLKHDDAKANEKTKMQGKLLKSANVVFGVGPILTSNASRHINKKVAQLTPGLPHIEPKQLIENNLAHPVFKVLVIGRVSEEDDPIKQVYLAIAATTNATHSDGLENVNWRLKVIGFDEEDSKFKKKIESLKAQGSTYINFSLLQFEKRQSELYEEISSSDLVLMPSLREGFGLVGWEAIAAGVPVIISAKSGLYEYLDRLGLSNMIESINIKGRLAHNGGLDKSDLIELSDKIINSFRRRDRRKTRALLLREILKDKIKATWEKTVDEFTTEIGITRSVNSFIKDPNNTISLLKSKDWEGISLRKLLEGLPTNEIDTAKNAAKIIYNYVEKKTSVEELGIIHHTLCWLGFAPNDEEFFRKAERSRLTTEELNMEFADIPSGWLTPGSNSYEIGRFPDEKLGKNTEVPSFYLGKAAVTNKQYSRFAEDETLYSWKNLKKSDFETYPVVSVNWWEAYIYSIWVGGRLPTEIEWEYACRAGTSTPYYSGKEISSPEYNFRLSNSDFSLSRNRPVPAISDTTDHPFGLFHVHGNVLEWCWNTYDEKSYPKVTPRFEDYQLVTRPKVARGGSWGLDSSACRSAFRNRLNSYYRNNDLGFRILIPKNQV